LSGHPLDWNHRKTKASVFIDKQIDMGSFMRAASHALFLVKSENGTGIAQHISGFASFVMSPSGSPPWINGG
jgi:hypothetical protein